MKRWAMILGCAVLFGMIACDKEEPQPTPTVTEEPEQPIPAATAPAEPPMAEVAVEADFEEKAAEEITAQNLEAELDKVEKELSE
jgi:hypothetical protein